MTDSSLELLLDTICNTFGGVLFLAILVVILLQWTSKEKDTSQDEPVPHAELLQARIDQARVVAQLERLQKAAKQQDVLASQFANPENEALLNRLNKLRRKRQVLMKKRFEHLRNISDNQVRINKIVADLERLDRAIQAARQELEDANAALKSELASRTQKAHLPQLHSTRKTEVGFLLRYGRLYLWHRYSRDGRRLGLNTDEFVVIRNTGTSIESAPKPYAGIQVVDGPTTRRMISDRLSQFDAHRDYLAIVVWPDSFKEFQRVKNEIVRQGFQYRLIPLMEGKFFVDRGGTNSDVQ